MSDSAEKRCARCGEPWPADEEFYYRLGDGRLHSYCRACCTERHRELRAGGARLVHRNAGLNRLPWWLIVVSEVTNGS
ncbi:MAG: hypothetical protein ABFD98_15745 [Syntrophobacteraceae bacterium]|nr:hypothetical protein [Desulfobacteraceae bacterium]